jgi:hypothetical protein
MIGDGSHTIFETCWKSYDLSHFNLEGRKERKKERTNGYQFAENTYSLRLRYANQYLIKVQLFCLKEQYNIHNRQQEKPSFNRRRLLQALLRTPPEPQ